MDQVDVVVIGAGVVGLAVARALALQGREVVVVEAADAIGTGTSSRNSEVIHAGLYYPPGSLKARLCVQGGICCTPTVPSAASPIAAVASWSWPRTRRRSPTCMAFWPKAPPTG